jgi:hypothetical protein
MKRNAIRLLAAVAAATGACGSSLPQANLVDSVRILGTSADKPYAMPGETVTLNVLAVDGRADRSRAMQVFWLPRVCMNPRGDDYFACYPSFASQFPPGVDLSGALVSGGQFVFTMPVDAISAAPARPGSPDPYGIAFAFVIACAGHVEYLPVDTTAQGAGTTPFGCFDDRHVSLGPDQFVFAFARVYAFTDKRNANPVIDHLTFGGAPVDPTAGITLDHCTASDETKCATTDVDTVVPDSSWEVDPGSFDPSGGPAHEGIWVDYYATAGRFSNDSVVLFDAHSGRVSPTTDGYAAPLSTGAQTLWAVVHDTRGGASWVSIPLNAK